MLLDRFFQTSIGQRVVSSFVHAVAVHPSVPPASGPAAVREKSKVAVASSSSDGDLDFNSFRSIVQMPTQHYDVLEDNRKDVAQEDITTYLELYTRLLWTYRCVFEIATSIAQMSYRIAKPTDKTKLRHTDIFSHPLFPVLRDPNPLQTQFELFWATISYLLLAGNAYWFIERDMTGSPYKLHCVRPDRVTPVPDSNGRKQYERVRPGKKTETWGYNDVVHFTMFNPVSDFWGLPAVMPGEDSAIIDLYLMRFDKAFYKNAIHPTYAIESDESMDDASFERTKREIRYWHQGVDKFHNVLLLEKAKIRQLRNEHHITDEMIESRKLTRDELFWTFGCHHLVSLGSNSNRSTLEMAYRMFWELTVLPLTVNIAQTISKELIWGQFSGKFGNTDIDFIFDTRSIKALKESQATESLMDFRYYQTGIQTGAEIREQRGFGDPLPWSEDAPPSVGYAKTRFESNEERAAMEGSFAQAGDIPGGSRIDAQKASAEALEKLEKLELVEMIRGVVREEVENAYESGRNSGVAVQTQQGFQQG